MRINSFADDRVIALLLLARSRWTKASGLALNAPKCVIVAGETDVRWYEEFVANCSPAQCMQVATASIYVGVIVGPTASQWQWGAVNRKAIKRLPHILAAPSLLGRTVFFNIHITRLYMYTAQFADPDSSAVRHYRQAVQRLTGSPRMAFPGPLLESVRLFGCAAEVRGLANLVRQAKAGMCLRGVACGTQCRRGLPLPGTRTPRASAQSGLGTPAPL